MQRAGGEELAAAVLTKHIFQLFHDNIGNRHSSRVTDRYGARHRFFAFRVFRCYANQAARHHGNDLGPDLRRAFAQGVKVFPQQPEYQAVA